MTTKDPNPGLLDGRELRNRVMDEDLLEYYSIGPLFCVYVKFREGVGSMGTDLGEERE